MSSMISVYSRDSFREFILPSVNNSDYRLTVRGDQLKVQRDIRLAMEIVGGKWKILGDRDYSLFVNDRRYDSVELTDGLMIRVATSDNETLTLIVSDSQDPFHAFDKYRISSFNSLSIGKDPSNDISYEFMGVSRKHATITRSGERLFISSDSPNGIYINSVRVDGTAELRFGDYVNIIGLHMLCLGSLIAVDTRRAGVKVNNTALKRVVPAAGRGRTDEPRRDKKLSTGKTVFRRSPRHAAQTEAVTIEIEGPPQLPQEKQQPLIMSIGPAFTMALPMLLGCALMIYSYRQSEQGISPMMYSGLVMAVSSAIVAVIWTLANRRHGKKEAREFKELRLSRYGEYLAAKDDEIRQLYVRAAANLNDSYPDAETCVGYDSHSAALWSRNSSHGDFLVHRLGRGDLPFPAEIKVPQEKFSMYDDELALRPEMIKSNYSMLYDVPVTVDLGEHRLIGLVGGEGKHGAMQAARVLSAQIAANNCYTDVKLAYIYDESGGAGSGDWDFARWLPHVWSEDRKMRYVASGAEEAADVMYELAGIFRARAEAENAVVRTAALKPHYVLFVEDMSLIEGGLLSKYIFDTEHDYGLTTVILAGQYEELPNKCEFIIENTREFRGYYDTASEAGRETPVAFDTVDRADLEAFARRLSALTVLEAESGGDLPESLTFLEMLGVSRPEDLPVRELWTKSRTYENIRGMLGQKAGGQPLYLDVHEKYHGPHGLVAGTTGSGKSETLQSYILSLAVNYSPDDVAFFIIDYKGGGMAHLFDGLPHMAGQISNLSGNQVRRAMISIKSENRRRQRTFAENGVNNINSYTRMYKAGEAAVPVPHLFIIIDEFAELKREEPEFMSELISVAQVGRSLGVHLILSTQKPSGTVDDNIWSNSRFRICLRVQDKQDSNDMLHKPDAAYLTQAGRGYLQVGSDELYELFQSGYSGAVYDPEAGGTDAARLLALTGRAEMTGSAVRQQLAGRQSVLKDQTELDAVRDHLAAVSREMGYTGDHRLWLPVLRDRIYLDELGALGEGTFAADGSWPQADRDLSLKVAVGMVDDPENQAQMPYELDFAEDGDLAVYGSVVSGKSTLLQTMAYSLIQRYSPEAVNMYAIDFSSRMLSAFEDAPHCGGVMYENDQAKIAKFFNMIGGALEERKKVLRGGSYRQYVRLHGVTMPAIFIFIDNYGAFRQKTEEAYEADVLKLAKEGISNGIYLVISGGGLGSGEIPSRLGENFASVLTLSLKDRYEYVDLLHTMQISVLPEAGVRGRGLAKHDGRVLEYQAATALRADNDYELMELIAGTCRDMAAAWKGRTARPVPEIPEKPTWEQFSALEEYEEVNSSPDRLAVGYDMASAAVYGVPLESAFCYGIYGEAGSGRTNMLRACVLSAAAKGAEIHIFDAADRPLGMFSAMEGIDYCVSDRDIFDCFSALTPELQARSRRRAELTAEGYGADEIYEVMRSEFRPVFMFIPEFDQFLALVYKSQLGMKGFLENVLSKGQNTNIYFFADLSLRSRAVASGYAAFSYFTGYRKGIQLGGKAASNQLLDFDYMPYSEQNKADKAGIGTLPEVHDSSEPSKIVIPLVRKRSAVKEGDE